MSRLNQSYDDLVKRLHESRTQLQSVRNSLKSLPENHESYSDLKELEADISELIALLEDLVRQKEREMQNGGVIGKIVEVFFNGDKRYGRVIDCSSEKEDGKETTSTCSVSIFGSCYDGSDSTPFVFKQDELCFLPQARDFAVGTRAQALYEEDGNWYNCTVLETKSDGYVVKYTDYENACEFVSFDMVRTTKPTPSCRCKTVTPTGEENDCSCRCSNIITTPGGYRIPENLIIKPTDSEKVRLEKKKKVSVIKKQQKSEILENQAKIKQMSWKNHINKYQNKSKTT